MMGRDEGSGMRAVTMSMGWGQVLLSRWMARRWWRLVKVGRRKPEAASFQMKEGVSGGGCLRSRAIAHWSQKRVAWGRRRMTVMGREYLRRRAWTRLRIWERVMMMAPCLCFG